MKDLGLHVIQGYGFPILAFDADGDGIDEIYLPTIPRLHPLALNDYVLGVWIRSPAAPEHIPWPLVDAGVRPVDGQTCQYFLAGGMTPKGSVLVLINGSDGNLRF